MCSSDLAEKDIFDEAAGSNWATPEDLSAAIKSGEIDPSTLLPPGTNRKERRAFAAKRKIPTPAPNPVQVPTTNPGPVLTTSTLMAEEWEKIERELMPVGDIGTSPGKRKWAKRLFMAGAFTLLSKLINSDVLDENDESTATPQDVNRVDAIWHELNEFFSQIAVMQ